MLAGLQTADGGHRAQRALGRTLADLEAGGYCTAVAYGLDAALAQIEA